jgi:hypothetical protein
MRAAAMTNEAIKPETNQSTSQSHSQTHSTSLSQVPNVSSSSSKKPAVKRTINDQLNNQTNPPSKRLRAVSDQVKIPDEYDRRVPIGQSDIILSVISYIIVICHIFMLLL